MPGGFYINIEPEALEDIQEAVDFYNSRKPGLGKRFYNTLEKHLQLLKKNHSSFALRYDDVRCMPIKNFPYMIHFRILGKDQTVSIKAVFCTHDDPNRWEERI
jgi:toxin ParE1/3/4